MDATHYDCTGRRSVADEAKTSDLLFGQPEGIDHKDSYRLAQHPGSYVALKYRRPVVKVKASETMHCPPAPAPESVIRGSRSPT